MLVENQMEKKMEHEMTRGLNTRVMYLTVC